jgi:LPS-assembly protein
MTDRWGLRGGVQYDTRLDNIANSSAAIEYRRDEDRMIQLTIVMPARNIFRQRYRNYDQNSINYKITAFRMVFLRSTSWPIADRWSIVGAYYFDTNANKAADQMVGLQYNSCCYALRVGYERKLNGWEKTIRANTIT